MKSKYELAKIFLEKNIELFNCPYCNEDMILDNHQLVCKNKHTIDISKKGTINFLGKSKYKESKIYNKNLFYNRRQFILNDFYNDLYEEIVKIIKKSMKNKKILILDIGCGEAIHSRKILQRIDYDYTYIGFDYSKDAISLSSDYTYSNSFFFVGDVNSVNIKSHSVDVILDILSPYNEKEIKRLLKKDGIFIKVSPGKNYLKELRGVQNLGEYKKEQEVNDNLTKQFDKLDKFEINNKFNITKEQYNCLLNMTPINNKNHQEICKEITIDLIIYVYGG